MTSIDIDARRPMNRSFLVVDIEKSSDRTNLEQLTLRRDLYRILDIAQENSAWSSRQWTAEDRGDGVMAVVDAPVYDLLEPFLEDVLSGLSRRNEPRPVPAWMRLRIGVHHGFVHRDRHGWVGEALTDTFRITNTEYVKDTLRSTVKAQAVVVVSDAVYHDVVRHGYVDHHAAYRSARTNDKPLWFRISGIQPGTN